MNKTDTSFFSSKCFKTASSAGSHLNLCRHLSQRAVNTHTRYMSTSMRLITSLTVHIVNQSPIQSWVVVHCSLSQSFILIRRAHIALEIDCHSILLVRGDYCV